MHFFTLLATFLSASPGTASGRVNSFNPPAAIRRVVSGDIGGTVGDSATGTPLASGEVRILQAGNLVATAVTDAFGRYVVHNLPAGAYQVEVRYLGYHAQRHDVSVGAT